MSDQLQQQPPPQQPHQLQRPSPTCCRWSFFYKGRRRKITPISTMSPSYRHHHHPRWCSSRNYYRWITLIHVLFLVILEGYCIEVASSARLPDIYWNSSNPIFRIDNTDHIIDVNRGTNSNGGGGNSQSSSSQQQTTSNSNSGANSANKFEYMYDQINVICPSYPTGTRSEDIETYIIYNVSDISLLNDNTRKSLGPLRVIVIN